MNEFLELLDYKNSPWLIILVAGLAGLVLSAIVIKAISITARKKDWPIIRAIHENQTSVLYFFIPLLIITLITKTYILSHPRYGFTHAISKIALIAVSTWLMTRVVIIIEKILIGKLDFDQPDNNDARKLFTKIKFVKRMFIILIIVFGVSILLLSFDSVRQYGVGILTSAGIFSVIIGFAAQKSLGNLLAGIQIAFTQPIKIDDVVIVEGEWGRIEEINLTYVVVNIWDLRRLILPITYFIEKPFQNWTRNDSSLIGTAFFNLNYQTPVEKLREKLHNILLNTPLWDGKSWALQVTDTQAQFMVIRALMSARNSSQAFDLRCLVREKIIEFIREEYPESLPGLLIEDKKHDQPGISNNFSNP
ncbi:mechanosensitive ion channel family protein [Dyadobacter sp. CY345]|uniref:mechanosensitive ion channel family protein n=1 Tax=Dyadobacter sp. CY345 TaxID=2909335 RepID=UPI001F213B7E|nr:mechanosensitive ion channel domain-containing protein [Dyadobacter sp. CY345]MCF2444597.1 mechanosensitive ion channel family protein [Dyadobacter sp. CY345]